MKNLLLSFAAMLLTLSTVAQTIFAEQIEAPADFGQPILVVPKSPLSVQILFIGGTDRYGTNQCYLW